MQVEFWTGGYGGKQFVHRLLPLARGKSHQQSERLRAPQSFARGPLGETGAEDLRARAFGQQADFETFKHCVLRSASTGRR